MIPDIFSCQLLGRWIVQLIMNNQHVKVTIHTCKIQEMFKSTEQSHWPVLTATRQNHDEKNCHQNSKFTLSKIYHNRNNRDGFKVGFDFKDCNCNKTIDKSNHWIVILITCSFPLKCNMTMFTSPSLIVFHVKIEIYNLPNWRANKQSLVSRFVNTLAQCWVVKRNLAPLDQS